MAVRHGYGKIAGTDALVFAYDTGDTRNSYRGEPTVNLASNANFSNGTTGWNANQNVTLSIETINNTRFLKVKSNQTTSTPGFKSGNITVTGNTVYTLTIRAYKNDSRSIWLYATGNGTGGSDIVWTSAPNGPNPITNTLTTISRTFTTPADMTYLQIGALWSTPLTTSEVYIEYMQLEAKSHATQFVNGTRSSTQGLLDLTGRSTVDIANVSFDSNAQMIFDGTDDYVEIPNTNLPAPGLNHTLECVFQRNSGRTIINYGPAFNGASKYYNLEVPSSVLVANITTSIGSTQLVSSTTISSNIWYHGILTYNGSTVSLYINGVLAASALTSGSILNTSTPSLNIGRKNSGNGEYINGKVGLVKIYNRALTADEVRNNYSNYKTRFNL